MSSIIIVEDDKRLAGLVGEFLQRAGYQTLHYASAEEMLEHCCDPEKSFSGIILDVMLPGIDGVQLTKLIRANDTSLPAQTPIILLTARGDIDDRIIGLEAGASDYLPKPFDPRELLLRVGNMLTAAPLDVAIMDYGHVRIETNTGWIWKSGQRIHLTERDREIILKLIAADGAAVPRNELGDMTWEAALNSRAIDVHINRLRRLIEQDPANPKIIRTHRNIGYSMAKPMHNFLNTQM